jgi:hypothetical protein
MYEPMMLRHRSWMPPMKRTRTMTVVIPRETELGSKMRRRIWAIAPKKDTLTVARASHMIASSGA